MPVLLPPRGHESSGPLPGSLFLELLLLGREGRLLLLRLPRLLGRLLLSLLLGGPHRRELLGLLLLVRLHGGEHLLLPGLHRGLGRLAGLAGHL